MSNLITDIRAVLELGWPAIVLILLFIVESDRRRRIDEHIRDLRAIVFSQHPDLEDWLPPSAAISVAPVRREAHSLKEPRVTADYNLNLLSLFHWRGPHESAA